ncbi:MAG TPA: rhomboid family intramembrane serine protease [Alphaproteobacteria bacterium]|nr:rhomboid family intramembrane serine protease [Alphaproteobacteria bacterium]
MTSSGDGQDYDDDSFGKQSNVIPLRPQKKKTEPPPPKPDPAHEPLINLPPYTKYLIAIILAIHVVVTLLLTAEQAHWVYINLGFIPGRFSGAAIFQPLALLTPLTHLFLHGSWLHVGMNTVMLLAFGSGVERWLGGQKMIFLFITSGLFGAATHFALNYDSISPVIGASGGLSGLFAAALIMINRYNDGMTGKYGMWPFIILWIGLSVVMGMMGSPDGSQIAWAAHVGGFLGGFIMLKLMKV